MLTLHYFENVYALEWLVMQAEEERALASLVDGPFFHGGAPFLFQKRRVDGHDVVDDLQQFDRHLSELYERTALSQQLNDCPGIGAARFEVDA